MSLSVEPRALLEQNFTQPIVLWLREWEDAGGLWKTIAYASAFFMMIACVMTVVGAPLFIYGAIEYGRQNTAARLSPELEGAQEQVRTLRTALERAEQQRPHSGGLGHSLVPIDPNLSSPLRRRTQQVAELKEQLADAQRERDELGRELAITRLEPQVFATQSLLKEVANLTHLRGNTCDSLSGIIQIAGALKTQFSEPKKFTIQISAIETLAQGALEQVKKEIA